MWKPSGCAAGVQLAAEQGAQSKAVLGALVLQGLSLLSWSVEAIWLRESNLAG